MRRMLSNSRSLMALAIIVAIPALARVATAEGGHQSRYAVSYMGEIQNCTKNPGNDCGGDD